MVIIMVIMKILYPPIDLWLNLLLKCHHLKFNKTLVTSNKPAIITVIIWEATM